MKVISRKRNKPKNVTSKKVVEKTTSHKTQKKHPKYGTSKLEKDFAKDFLDKLGLKYVYQFEAKSCGRFYDFAIFINGDVNDCSFGNILLLEIDGSYWHSDPRLVTEDKMNPTQKKNKRVDNYKNKWALEHGMPLMRIWEKDIRENPKEVLKELKERFFIADKKLENKVKKNKRHVNKLR